MCKATVGSRGTDSISWAVAEREEEDHEEGKAEGMWVRDARGPRRPLCL
jgi:hypothetical protein